MGRNQTKREKVFNCFLKIEGMLISLLIAFFVAVLIYCFSFYVHEVGHIVYGSFNSLLRGEPLNFTITNWINCPIFTFIKLPQQTFGKKSLNFAFGGIIFTILVTTFVSGLFHKKTKNKLYWLFPVIFTYEEFFGNFLCGTDNWQYKPFPICKNWFISNAIHLVIPSLTILISLLIYPKISKFLEKLIKAKNQFYFVY